MSVRLIGTDNNKKAALETLPATTGGATEPVVPIRFWTIVGLMAIAAGVYWPSVSALYGAWTDFHGLGYTHGPLIAIASIALLFRRRRELESVPARPWFLAFMALSVCSLAWLVCVRASIQDLHVLLFPAILLVAVAAVFGPQVARVAALPIGFFYFASPAWGQLSPYLQSMTVAVMRALIALTGMNVTVSGDVIHMAFGTFIIETGCSGLHFLLVGLAVATLHGELRNDALALRIRHIVVMGALALLANWVRVYTVVRAGYETHMRHILVSRGHYYFGWAVFALALLAFFGLARWYSRRYDSRAAGRALNTELTSPAATQNPSIYPGRMSIAFAAAGLSMMAAPALSFALKSWHGTAGMPRVGFAHFQEWAGPYPADGSAWKPEFAGADVLEQRRYYSNLIGEVQALGVAYATQQQGSELVGDTSSVTGPRETGAEQQVRTAAGPFRETTVAEQDGRESVIWYRYEIGGRSFTVPLAAQLWYGVTALVGEPVSGLIALRVQCLPDCRGARRRLESLALRSPVSITTASLADGALAREKADLPDGRAPEASVSL